MASLRHMDGGFEMTHGSLEVSASHLRVHGMEYQAALQWLRERRDGGASWGDDGLMSFLASAYTECTHTALDAFTHMGNVIGATGDALSTASRQVSYVEDDTTHLLLTLDGESGGSWV
ncbi:hypothetical protein [Sphaerisporangium flaviroseum]